MLDEGVENRGSGSWGYASTETREHAVPLDETVLLDVGRAELQRRDLRHAVDAWGAGETRLAWEESHCGSAPLQGRRTTISISTLISGL